MNWLGETAEDRRTTVGLIAVVVALSPLILLGELLYALGVPCR